MGQHENNAKHCFKKVEHSSTLLVGADGDEGPPVPIPNTVVKLVCVDNTRWATAREDR